MGTSTPKTRHRVRHWCVIPSMPRNTALPLSAGTRQAHDWTGSKRNRLEPRVAQAYRERGSERYRVLDLANKQLTNKARGALEIIEEDPLHGAGRLPQVR